MRTRISSFCLISSLFTIPTRLLNSSKATLATGIWFCFFIFWLNFFLACSAWRAFLTFWNLLRIYILVFLIFSWIWLYSCSFVISLSRELELILDIFYLKLKNSKIMRSLLFLIFKHLSLISLLNSSSYRKLFWCYEQIYRSFYVCLY